MNDVTRETEGLAKRKKTMNGKNRQLAQPQTQGGHKIASLLN